MFLRGRPITMYIPSGIRSLEELPSGPPPETLSLDWVYPAPSRPMGTIFPILGTATPPLYGLLLGLRGQGDLNPPLPSSANGTASQKLCPAPLFLILPLI